MLAATLKATPPALKSKNHTMTATHRAVAADMLWQLTCQASYYQHVQQGAMAPTDCSYELSHIQHLLPTTLHKLRTCALATHLAGWLSNTITPVASQTTPHMHAALLCKHVT